jgi:hypothetical protein
LVAREWFRHHPEPTIRNQFGGPRAAFLRLGRACPTVSCTEANSVELLRQQRQCPSLSGPKRTSRSSLMRPCGSVSLSHIPTPEPQADETPRRELINRCWFKRNCSLSCVSNQCSTNRNAYTFISTARSRALGSTVCWQTGPVSPGKWSPPRRKPVGSSHHPKLADRLRRANSVRRFQCYERSVYCYARYILAPDSPATLPGRSVPKL